MKTRLTAIPVRDVDPVMSVGRANPRRPLTAGLVRGRLYARSKISVPLLRLSTKPRVSEPLRLQQRQGPIETRAISSLAQTSWPLTSAWMNSMWRIFTRAPVTWSPLRAQCRSPTGSRGKVNNWGHIGVGFRLFDNDIQPPEVVYRDPPPTKANDLFISKWRYRFRNSYGHS